MKPTAGLVRKLGTMISGSLVSMALGFALSVLLARLLGPVGLASYATVTIAGTLLGQLNDLGLANAFAFYARLHPESMRMLLAMLRRHVAFCAVISAAAVLLARIAGDESISGAVSPGWFIVVLVVFVTLVTPSYILPVLVLARGDYRRYVVVSNAGTALQLCAVGAVTATIGPTWRGFILVMTVVQLCVITWTVAYLKRTTQAASAPVTPREVYRYGLRVKWSVFMKLLSGRIDLLIVAGILSVREVGAYSVAVSFREFGLTPLRTYAGILQNLLVDRARTGEDDSTLVVGSLMLQGAISLVLSTAAAVTLPIVIPLLYGPEFAHAAGPSVVLLFSAVFTSIMGLCWIVFNMWGLPGLTNRIVTVSGLLGPVVVWIGASEFGLYGAVFAGVVNAGLTCLATLAVLLRLRRYTVADGVGIARRLPTLFASAVWE